MTPSDGLSKPPVRPRRSALRRILRGGAILGTLIVAFALVLPSILSMDWARTRLERELTAALGTEVRIGGYGFGWFSGLSIEGVSIANPPTFAADERLLDLRSLRGDAKLAGLVRGRFEMSGVVDGLELRVRQHADGTTNLEELIGLRASVETGPGRGDGEGRSGALDLRDVRFDFELRDSLVEFVHDERGVIEQMQRMNARLSKEFDTQIVRLEFACDLHRPDDADAKGHIELRLEAEPDRSRPIDAHVNCIGVDLSRYRALLAMFVPDDQLTAFAGVLTANVSVRGVPTEGLRSEGNLELAGPHFAGPLLQGMDLRTDRWTLRPNLVAKLSTEGALTSLDLAGLVADLGFATLQGQSSAVDADGLAIAGLDFDIDVAKLAEAGGPMPELLRGTGSALRGGIHVPLRSDLASLDLAALLASITFDGSFAMRELRIADQALTGIDAQLGMRDGKVTVTGRGGSFDGGALRLQLAVDTADLTAPPLSLSVGLDRAALGPRALSALQYVVPLFAGLDAAQATAGAVQFHSTGDLRIELVGTAFPREGQSVLGWLDGFRGQGKLGLREGSFQPAPALSGLLQLTGESGKLSFESIDTDFVVRQGGIESGLAKLSTTGREFGLTGRTGLRGDIDYTIDVRDMLKGHRDGARILEYLGDKPVGAKLVGTLDAPSLALPDLTEIAKQAVQSAIEAKGRELVEKEAGNLLDTLFGRRKEAEDPKSSPAPKPEDAARKALEDLLRGLGRKK